MFNLVKHYWAKPHIKNIVLLKVAITIGLVAIYFLPSEYSWAAGLPANLLWLWRT